MLHFSTLLLPVCYQSQVTHIQGETGCGKSTRLPQFILEDKEATASFQHWARLGEAGHHNFLNRMPESEERSSEPRRFCNS